MTDKQANSPKRCPLHLPGGWMLHKNEFYPEEPLLENGEPNDYFNTSEDILWAERLGMGFHMIDKRHETVTIDLGWYGGNQQQGRFRLVALRGQWSDDDNVIDSFESRSYQEILATLNLWFNTLY